MSTIEVHRNLNCLFLLKNRPGPIAVFKSEPEPSGRDMAMSDKKHNGPSGAQTRVQLYRQFPYDADFLLRLRQDHEWEVRAWITIDDVRWLNRLTGELIAETEERDRKKLVVEGAEKGGDNAKTGKTEM